ncbi:MAG: DNA topoisomerase III, partial [Halothiobacillus sp. 28-55-5]
VLGVQSKDKSSITTSDGVVTWAFGHLLEQAPPDAYDETLKRWALASLPIVPAQWKVEVKNSAKDQFKAIAALLKKASEVVIATDADREGEMIARELMAFVGFKGKVQRLWLSALDVASVKKALAALKPGAETAGLYQSALGRSRADWLVGMNLTRAFTLAGRSQGGEGVRSVGRVQTPTLSLVVARDRQIEHFKPVPYFELLGLFEAGQIFSTKWKVPEGAGDEAGRCVDQSIVDAVASKITGKTGTVSQNETKRISENPPLPFSLSTLQKTCSAKFGLGAQEVLDIAQALYETHKATTYPRSDCNYLPEEQFHEASGIVKALASADPDIHRLSEKLDLSRKSPAWNTKKITAHHAIIPTHTPPNLEAMNGNERKVYELIRRHYLAQFLPPYEYDRTQIDITIEAELFQTTGKIEQMTGWRMLYGKADLADDEPNDDDEQTLPALTQGQAVPLTHTEVAAKQTKPPSRYTEGTLIDAMQTIGKHITDSRLKAILKENSGIGTEATRAGIIANLIERDFIGKKGKQVISSDTGRSLIDALPESVKSPTLTALWEQSLEEIADGKRELAGFEADVVKFITAITDQIKKQHAEAPAPARPTADCPACKAQGQAEKVYSSKKQCHYWHCKACDQWFDDAAGKPVPKSAASSPKPKPAPRKSTTMRKAK